VDIAYFIVPCVFEGPLEGIPLNQVVISLVWYRTYRLDL